MKIQLACLCSSIAYLGAGILAAGAASAQAAILLPPGATWEYTFVNPTGNPTWNTTTGGSWATGAAPFGNVGGAGYAGVTEFNYNTLWAAEEDGGHDLWMRIAVDFTGYDVTTAFWELGVSNGFKLYANGALVGEGMNDNDASRWDHSGMVWEDYLNPGVNVFAVALEQDGGRTAFDMQLRAEEALPLPRVAEGGSALVLLGLATLGAGLVRGVRPSPARS